MRSGGPHDPSCRLVDCVAGPAAASADYILNITGVSSRRRGIGQKIGRIRRACERLVEEDLPELERVLGAHVVVSGNEALLNKARILLDRATQSCRRRSSVERIAVTKEQYDDDLDTVPDAHAGTLGPPRVIPVDFTDWESMTSTEKLVGGADEVESLQARLHYGAMLETLAMNLRSLGNEVLFGRSEVKRRADARPVDALALFTLAAVVEADNRGYGASSAFLSGSASPSRSSRTPRRQGREQDTPARQHSATLGDQDFLQDVCRTAVSCWDPERLSNTITQDASRTRRRLQAYLQLLLRDLPPQGHPDGTGEREEPR